MKKLLFIAIVFLITGTTQAQTVFSLKWNTYSKTLDTVTNTGVKTSTITVLGVHDQLSAHVTVTKISGTVAGKIYWQASTDGTNFASLDSVTITDLASATYQYNRTTTLPFVYFRVRAAGSGTMSASVTGTAFTRPKTRL